VNAPIPDEVMANNVDSYTTLTAMRLRNAGAVMTDEVVAALAASIRTVLESGVDLGYGYGRAHLESRL
jgi:hypothetical protein